MALTVSSILSSMLAAAKESLGEDWSKAEHYAKPELKKLAQSLVDIARLRASGKVTTRQAKALLGIHENTVKTVLLTLEGLGVIAAENAVNEATKAVRDIVNSAAGFRIL